jgi:hypothetical protein
MFGQTLARKFGNAEVVIDMDLLTYDMMDDIADGIRDVRLQRSSLNELPMDAQETVDDYYIRLAIYRQDKRRRKDETIEAHTDRLLRPKLDLPELGYDILTVFCKLWDQPTPSKEEYKSSKWFRTQAFIFDLLYQTNITELAEDFAPKRLVSLDEEGAEKERARSKGKKAGSESSGVQAQDGEGSA